MKAVFFSSFGWPFPKHGQAAGSTFTIAGGSAFSGTEQMDVEYGGFGDSLGVSVHVTPQPSLELDDAVLNLLPGACSRFQTTRLRAIIDGVDIGRLLTFESSSPGVAGVVNAGLSLDRPHPTVIGYTVGSATLSIMGRSASFAGVLVEVSSQQVEVSSMACAAVTSIELQSSTGKVDGPFERVPRQLFSSEDHRICLIRLTCAQLVVD